MDKGLSFPYMPQNSFKFLEGNNVTVPEDGCHPLSRSQRQYSIPQLLCSLAGLNHVRILREVGSGKIDEKAENEGKTIDGRMVLFREIELCFGGFGCGWLCKSRRSSDGAQNFDEGKEP